jgi:hypothetical protein
MPALFLLQLPLLAEPLAKVNSKPPLNPSLAERCGF